MKTIKKTILATLLSGVLLSQTACLGSFALTVKVYEFNNELTDNKFINNLVFWLVGGPVYGFTTTADVVFFNLIEFWSGSNPIAFAPMEPGEDRFAFEGRDFKVNRSADRVVMQEMNGETVVQEMVLSFSTPENAWYMEQNGEKTKMFSYEGDQVIFHFGDQQLEMAAGEVNNNLRGLQQNDLQWAMR